jgi:hypothetical protein
MQEAGRCGASAANFNGWIFPRSASRFVFASAELSNLVTNRSSSLPTHLMRTCLWRTGGDAPPPQAMPSPVVPSVWHSGAMYDVL